MVEKRFVSIREDSWLIITNFEHPIVMHEEA